MEHLCSKYPGRTWSEGEGVKGERGAGVGCSAPLRVFTARAAHMPHVIQPTTGHALPRTTAHVAYRNQHRAARMLTVRALACMQLLRDAERAAAALQAREAAQALELAELRKSLEEERTLLARAHEQLDTQQAQLKQAVQAVLRHEALVDEERRSAEASKALATELTRRMLDETEREERLHAEIAECKREVRQPPLGWSTIACVCERERAGRVLTAHICAGTLQASGAAAREQALHESLAQARNQLAQTRHESEDKSAQIKRLSKRVQVAHSDGVGPRRRSVGPKAAARNCLAHLSEDILAKIAPQRMPDWVPSR